MEAESFPRRFGGGDGEGVVAEAGDEVEPSAERLHVAGEGVDGSQVAALDPGDPAGVTPMAWASWVWVRPWCLRSSASRWPPCAAARRM